MPSPQFRPSPQERLKRFKSDEARRTRLRLLLSDEVMLEAMGILRDLSLPTATGHVLTADTTALSLALTHTSQAGAHAYARALELMCDPEDEEKGEAPEAPGLATSSEEIPTDFQQRRVPVSRKKKQ